MSQLPPQPPPFHSWKPQSTLDAVVSAMWHSFCPGQRMIPNHDLGPIFAKMSQDLESATMPLYTNYFDPVTDLLPNSFPLGHKLNFNLRLNCFDSWADPERERGRERHRHVPSYGGPRISGACLSRLTRNGAPSESRGSMTNSQFIYQMYGYHCRVEDL